VTQNSIGLMEVVWLLRLSAYDPILIGSKKEVKTGSFSALIVTGCPKLFFSQRFFHPIPNGIYNLYT